MPRFAANLTMLFTEVSPLERPSYAAQAGFDGVEILFPYDTPVADWARALDGMPLALINTPPGDWASGERGFAAVPGMEARFRDSFLRGADYATRLGAARLHVMAGVGKGPVAEETFLSNLTWAVAQVPDLRLTLEPLNPADMPGYFLNDYDHAARMIDDLALPQIGLQFDLWHATRLYGQAAFVWEDHKSRVSHVQISGFPNRAEPGGGGFDLTALCNDLDAMAFDGWLAAEYVPAAGTLRGLGWLTALKGRTALIGTA
jgi:2-dehydrotetronate isomerase